MGLASRKRFRATLNSGTTEIRQETNVKRFALIVPAPGGGDNKSAQRSDRDQMTPPCVRYGVIKSGRSRNQMRSQVSTAWR